jgi:hypothetical protein
VIGPVVAPPDPLVVATPGAVVACVVEGWELETCATGAEFLAVWSGFQFG